MLAINKFSVNFNTKHTFNNKTDEESKISQSEFISHEQNALLLSAPGEKYERKDSNERRNCKAV